MFYCNTQLDEKPNFKFLSSAQKLAQVLKI